MTTRSGAFAGASYDLQFGGQPERYESHGDGQRPERSDKLNSVARVHSLVRAFGR